MPSTLQLQTYTTTTTTNTPTTTTTTFATDFNDSSTSMVSVTTMASQMKPSLAQELSKQLSLFCTYPEKEMNLIATYHNHEIRPNQCCSVVVHRIAAPIDTVWALVRRFDEPQTYKHFLRSCRVIAGDGGEVGCLREVHVISGIPAVNSTERLEVLDEESHAIGFSVVKGEHRLQNYRSVTTLHPSQRSGSGSGLGTVVVESYVVDVPPGNTKEETCVFVDTIVRCNLQSLTKIAEKMARSLSSSSNSSPSSSSSSSCKVS